MVNAEVRQARDPVYGWVMVGVVFLLTALSFGGLGSVGIFLKPMIAEFGWSRGETAMGYSSLSIAAAVMGIVWGFVADRWGSRAVSFVGYLSMPLALYMLGQTEALWQFYLFYFIFGGFGFAALWGPLVATVGFWFEHRKGLAIGLMAAGGAAGQGLIPYIARLLITEHGWQSAYEILGLGYLVLALPLVLAVREAPARLAAMAASGDDADDGAAARAEYPVAPREALAWISAAVVFCCICMSVPIVHVVPLVSDRGIAPETAASVLMVLMLAGILGRILGGVLSDRLGALPAFMLLSFAQTVLVLWFPFVESLQGTYILSIAFGIAYSGDMAIIIMCMRVMVPAAMAGRALGIAGFFGMLGMGLGGYQGGVLYDLTGDYQWSHASAALAGVINLIILSLFLVRRNRLMAKPVAA